jgi:Bacterial Ig domain
MSKKTTHIAIAATALLLVGAPAATAAGVNPQRQILTDEPGSAFASSLKVPLADASHHGPSSGHLPAAQHNLELVGELEPTEEFGDIEPGQIADLAVHKGFAYLNSWDSPVCERGGTYVVDIGDPSDPEEIGFIPAPFPFYHGEGAHVVSLDTPEFTGDILAVNNEVYGSNLVAECSPTDKEPGGFGLYDVSDPNNPVTMVGNFGDESPDDGTVTPVEEEAGGNSSHSVFVWEDRAAGKAYLVASDNIEQYDVDIYDITDPANPEFIAEYDLDAEFPQILDGEEANGAQRFLHDMVVKKIGDRYIMLADYWDAGYVQLDVTDPENATYINDTTYSGEEPMLPGSGLFREGNAHQAEFSFDNEFTLAADEDFATHPILARITEAPFEDFQFGGVLADSEPIEPGTTIEGDTLFVGQACDASPPPAPPVGVVAALAERGSCPFQEKMENIQAAGYELGLIFNNVNGANAQCDGLINMLLDPEIINIPGIFIGRSNAFRIMNLFDGYTCVPNDLAGSTPAPAPPVDGLAIRITSTFDGWGYAHLYDAETGEELDTFAIPEAFDERFATGFGDLSIHEFATDPTENLAYSSYYSGGMRVFRFGRDIGLQQAGVFIDEDGSNFWGVEQFTTPDGERLIAGSDRDFGLQIFRYTGPGAAQPPSCSDVVAATAPDTAVTVPLSCADPNGNPLQLSIDDGPDNGTLGEISGNEVTYTPNAGFNGQDKFTYRASDGAASSAPATVSVIVNPSKAPATSNRLGLRLGKFKNGKIIVVVNVAAPGRLNLGLRVNVPGASAAKAVRIARKSTRLGRAGTHRVTLRASRAGRRKLARALAKSKRGRVRASLRASWTPTGGSTRKTRRGLTIGG